MFVTKIGQARPNADKPEPCCTAQANHKFVNNKIKGLAPTFSNWNAPQHFRRSAAIQPNPLILLNNSHLAH
jgi:hypothetical protein